MSASFVFNKNYLLNSKIPASCKTKSNDKL